VHYSTGDRAFNKTGKKYGVFISGTLVKKGGCSFGM
jgi:hypothetical protein